jgi:hypothetical protein
MAAAIVLDAATAEQQIFELAHKLRAAIDAYNAVDGQSAAGLNVTYTINTASKVGTISVTLPLTESADADGGISYDATEVMV